MTARLSAPKWTIKGIVDDCTTCECCGRTNLKRTVALMPLDADGNEEGTVTYYGTSCAAAELRWTQTQVTNAARRASREHTEHDAWAREIITVFGPLEFATAVEQGQVWFCRNPHSNASPSREIDDLLARARGHLSDTTLGPARPHTVADLRTYWVLWDSEGQQVLHTVAAEPDREAARRDLREKQRRFLVARRATRTHSVQALDEQSARAAAYTAAALARYRAEHQLTAWV
ncbi:hypothetical protein ACTWJ8_39805 (plasmid) [Streptomyces sp. SDT5-1]|uniref:hypothetical protein n=1 Tax=Streptomyces sp. SDT5-1 TaxID=3406418 RepID=UPI003FCF2823